MWFWWVEYNTDLLKQMADHTPHGFRSNSKENKKPSFHHILWFKRLWWFLRAAPRKYQLDVEIVKK